MSFLPTLSSLRNSEAQSLPLFLGLAPLFLVTLSWWSSAVLILGAFVCLVCLLRAQSKPHVAGLTAASNHMRLMVVVLFAPVLSIMVSSLLRGSHVWANYDSPSRFWVAIAIFLYLVRQRANMALYLQYTVPIGLLLTLGHQIFFFQPQLWGPDRMATYFADPLVFGYTSLTLGVMSLVSLHSLKKDSWSLVMLKLAGAAAGVYLSVMSGSRTGWLAAPVVMLIWMFRQKFLRGKLGFAVVFGLVVLVLIGFSALPAMVQQRWMLGLHEALDYPWNGMAPETSVGFRITFLRIALDMFINSPFAGHGDNGYDLLALPVHVYSYASPESLRMAFNAGFHNEMVSNTVRFGLSGLLAAAMLFFVPMVLFFRQSTRGSVVQQANAMMGLVLTICFFVSSLSTEVFDLKYMASFYAVMVSMLCASVVALPGNNGKTAVIELGA